MTQSNDVADPTGEEAGPVGAPSSVVRVSTTTEGQDLEYELMATSETVPAYNTIQ